MLLHLPLIFTILLTLALAACASPNKAPVPTADAPQSAPAAAPSSGGLDAMLTKLEYPYPVSTFKVSVQGQPLKMAYMDVSPQGQARGAVLLLHGKNFSGAYWERTIKALVAQGYRVVVPDQLGFGKSSKPTNIQYSFHQLAALTRALLAELKIDEVSVIGHSMGGMVASRFVLMYPELARQLVLVNPIGLEDWKRVAPYRSVDDWTQAELKKDASSIKTYMQNAYFAGQWDEAYDPLLTIQEGWAKGPDRELMAKVSALTYDMIFTQPVLYELPDIKAPTLLIIGQRDKTALGKQDVSEEVAATLGDYPKLGRSTRDAIPNAKLVELDDVGHVPQFERFDEYIKATGEFLGAGWPELKSSP